MNSPSNEKLLEINGGFTFVAEPCLVCGKRYYQQLGDSVSSLHDMRVKRGERWYPVCGDCSLADKILEHQVSISLWSAVALVERLNAWDNGDPFEESACYEQALEELKAVVG